MSDIRYYKHFPICYELGGEYVVADLNERISIVTRPFNMAHSFTIRYANKAEMVADTLVDLKGATEVHEHDGFERCQYCNEWEWEPMLYSMGGRNVCRDCQTQYHGRSEYPWSNRNG